MADLNEELEAVEEFQMEFVELRIHHQTEENKKGGDHSVKIYTTLRHWCGGCHEKANGTDNLAHPATPRGTGSFNNLFV